MLVSMTATDGFFGFFGMYFLQGLGEVAMRQAAFPHCGAEATK
jgi:hypothetical protein